MFWLLYASGRFPHAGCYHTSAAARGNGRECHALMSWRARAINAGGRQAGRVPAGAVPVPDLAAGRLVRPGGRGAVLRGAGDGPGAAVAGAGGRAGARRGLRRRQRRPGRRRAAAAGAGRAAAAGLAGRADPAGGGRVGLAAAGRGDQPGAGALPRARAGQPCVDRARVAVLVRRGAVAGPLVVGAAAGRGPPGPRR